MRRAYLQWALWTVLISSPVSAREGDVTIDSSVEPMFIDGELQGCSIVFDVAHPDTEYRRGEMVHLSGSVNYNLTSQNAPVITVKLGVSPLGSTNAFVAPAEVYLVSGTATNKADEVKSAAGETPGYRLFLFRAAGESVEDLMLVAKTDRLELGYAMQPGGLLSQFEVDPQIKRIDIDDPKSSDVDPGAPKRWLDCISNVTEAAIHRLKKR